MKNKNIISYIAKVFFSIKKEYLLFIMICIEWNGITLGQTTQSYFFNGNFNPYASGSPLVEQISCGADYGDFTTSPDTTDYCSGNFCFEAGGGLSFQNSNFITSTFSINLYCSFNTLGGWTRIIDFSNSTQDAGIYLLNNSLDFYPNGDVGPPNFFSPNTYYLFSFTRDGSTGLITIYVNGILFSSYNDASNLYNLPSSTSPVVFFYDDPIFACEVKPGCVKYLDVRDYTMDSSDVANLWTSFLYAEEEIITDLAVCDSTSTTITATGLPTSGSFLWSTGETTPSINVSPTTTTSYSCVYSLNVCSSIISTINITINPTPTVITSDTTICENSTVTLTASGSASDGNYLWNTGDTTVSISVTPSSTTSYSCVYTLNECPSASATSTVTLTDLTRPTFLQLTPICPGAVSPILPSASLEGITGIWTPPLIDNTTSSSYTFEPNSGQCASDTSLNMLIYQNPETLFTTNPSELTNENPLCTMVNNSINAVSYSWDFNDGSTSEEINPEHLFPGNMTEDQLITLVAISEYGCTDTLSVIVKLSEDLFYYIPNSFIPDDDGINDIFLPVFTPGYDPENFSFVIYNRWGQEIFTTQDATVGWNGKDDIKDLNCQNGVYPWKINYVEKVNGRHKVFTGFVSLIR